jgi:hypothetical protein
MSISITNIRIATNDEWDFVWKECDYSTYFHSREWAEIWQVYTKGKMSPEPKLMTFSDGRKALLPLTTWKTYKGLIKNSISSPAGTFGGWIASDKLDVEHAVLLTECLTRKCGNLSWRLNPYEELVFKTGVRTDRDEETNVLNLKPGFDAILAGWDGENRRVARKAMREGVSIRLASGIDDWKAYYEVYQDTLRRWGKNATSKYRWELFEEMSRRNSQFIRLWLAVYQDVVVAGALNFHTRKHVVGWHAATLEKYIRLHPFVLLIYEGLRTACEEGYAWFDFNPSGGHEGAKTFKEGFGVKPLYCPMVHVVTVTSKLATRTEKLWQGNRDRLRSLRRVFSSWLIHFHDLRV